MRHSLTIALAGLMSLPLVNTVAAQDHAHGAGHVMLLPAELRWADIPSLPPGAQIAVIEGPLNEARPITARLRFPTGYRLPAHHHPVIEHVTVLSGTFHMGAGDRLDPSKTMALSTGGFAIMPPRTPHFAWTSEETIVQIHSVGPWGVTYVNPAEDPRRQ